MATAIGGTLAVLVAVAGWIINQALARRAIRRNMRIDYLLTAYRRLENASNRRMTPANETELEAALSDIQLLGTAEQVEMASQFARQFATERQADCEPLLDDLRASLRQELLLDPVRASRVVLRISSGDEQGAPSVVSGAWAYSSHGVVTNVFTDQYPKLSDATLAAVPSAGALGEGIDGLIERSPLAAVVAAHDRLGQQLVALLKANDPTNTPRGNVSELAVEAHRRSLISQSSRDAVEGLGVMHMLARLDDASNHLDQQRAREYVTLAEATSYAMRQDASGSRYRPPK